MEEDPVLEQRLFHIGVTILPGQDEGSLFLRVISNGSEDAFTAKRSMLIVESSVQLAQSRSQALILLDSATRVVNLLSRFDRTLLIDERFQQSLNSWCQDKCCLSGFEPGFDPSRDFKRWYNHLADGGNVEKDRVVQILSDTVVGVQELHSVGVHIGRDCLNKVVLLENGVAKVAFGHFSPNENNQIPHSADCQLCKDDVKYLSALIDDILFPPCFFKIIPNFRHLFEVFRDIHSPIIQILLDFRKSFNTLKEVPSYVFLNHFGLYTTMEKSTTIDKLLLGIAYSDDEKKELETLNIQLERERFYWKREVQDDKLRQVIYHPRCGEGYTTQKWFDKYIPNYGYTHLFKDLLKAYHNANRHLYQQAYQSSLNHIDQEGVFIDPCETFRFVERCLGVASVAKVCGVLIEGWGKQIQEGKIIKAQVPQLKRRRYFAEVDRSNRRKILMMEHREACFHFLRRPC